MCGEEKGRRRSLQRRERGRKRGRERERERPSFENPYSLTIVDEKDTLLIREHFLHATNM